jgi:hypothetical protein
MQPETEAAIERGRELYAEIFDSPFSEDVLSLLEGNSTLDNIIFALFYDSVMEGYVVDITDVLSEQMAQGVDDFSDGSPIYGVTAMKLRTLMCAALTIGMWHQKVTNDLDSIWANGVDKNSESA